MCSTVLLYTKDCCSKSFRYISLAEEPQLLEIAKALHRNFIAIKLLISRYMPQIGTLICTVIKQNVYAIVLAASYKMAISLEP